MKYITESEVDQYLPIGDAISILEEAFSDYAAGKSSYTPRSKLRLEKGALVVMPGYFHKYGVTGLKAYVGSQKKHRHVVIFNAATGEALAAVESSRMGQLKTGALPAMVTKKLLKGRNQAACIVGSGFQARGQLEGLAEVFNLERVTVYSRKFENALKFAEEMSSRLGIEVKACETISGALNGSSVVSSATSSNEPLIYRKDLGDTYHVNLVGANVPSRREAANDVLENSDLVVVEDMEQAMSESSEIMDFMKSSTATECIEMKDLFQNSPRENVQKSVFKSMGVGLEDVAVATALLRNMKIL